MSRWTPEPEPMNTALLIQSLEPVCLTGGSCDYGGEAEDVFTKRHLNTMLQT